MAAQDDYYSLNEDLDMRRRTFIASSVAGAVTGALATRFGIAEAAQQERAIAALRAAKRVQAAGNFTELRNAYHSDAVLMEPALRTPAVGRAAIAENLRKTKPDRTLLYFYYRQPETLEAGNEALVVSNYEAGYKIGDRTVEDSGKTTNVVLLGPNPPLIAQEVVVPNIYAGSYGSLGTALAQPRFGRFPLRALGRPPFRTPTTAGGGENDVLFNLVRQINRAWVEGRPEEILSLANPSGAFLIGDYSPFYITGTEAFREHFADFYRTGSVTSLQELNPTVRIWGNMAAVAFDFDLDYRINNQVLRAPGRAVYSFVKGAAPAGAWRMAACAATHLVGANIGDPYPVPG